MIFIDGRAKRQECVAPTALKPCRYEEKPQGSEDSALRYRVPNLPHLWCYVSQSRSLYQAPANGRNQGRPL